MAPESASADRASTRRPVKPSETASVHPGTRVATSGTSMAPHSSATVGSPSRYVGSTQTSSAA